MKLVKSVANGKLYSVEAENVTLPVMHLWGSPSELGRAVSPALQPTLSVRSPGSPHVHLNSPLPLPTRPSTPRVDCQCSSTASCWARTW